MDQSLILSNYTQLWAHINTKRRIQLGILFLLMIFTSIAEVASIGSVIPFLSMLVAPENFLNLPLIQPFLSIVNYDSPQQLLLPLTIIFIATALLAGTLRLILLWAQMRISYEMGAGFSVCIYERTLYQTYSTHVARNSSEIVSAIISKSNELVYGALYPFLVLLASALMFGMILTALVFIDPIIAVAASLGFGIIYFFVIFLTKKQVSKDAYVISREQSEVVKALQEGLGGIRDILLDGSQQAYVEIYRRSENSLRRAQANVQIMGTCPRFLIEAVAMALIAWLAYMICKSSEGGTRVIPVLGALALGAQRLLPILQQAYAAWTQIHSSKVSVRDALILLNQPMPVQDQKSTLPFENGVMLSDISYRYSTDRPWIVKNITLSFKRGERIGIIGTTGSGKSTLIDIVMALLQPVEGNLIVDGCVIDSQNQLNWQANIAHVPQNIFLADASIAENIAFGVDFSSIDFERVYEVAKKVQIFDAVMKLDSKFKTKIGERGVRLSGGERQRIGIARALYKKASIIIFDEATSALDIKTEREVMEAIEYLDNNLTIIIIAHRITTLSKCNNIYELKNGAISHYSSYEELLKNNDK